jgi:dienelactone hydrolase
MPVDRQGKGGDHARKPLNEELFMRRSATSILPPSLLLLALLALLALPDPSGALAATPTDSSATDARLDQVLQAFESLNHRLDALEKRVDDGLWFDRVGDVATVEKVRLWGPPRWKEESETAIGAGNPVKFWAYVFVPRDIDRKAKVPLLVFPHGGVHADFSTYYTHIVREMVGQGYVVVAPEYRGSTGYGRETYESIDYGGLEIEDVHACRAYVLENYPFVDGGRVGMIGWSHGGLISLMNVFDHPDDYACAYAGVPVSDLIARLGYLDDDYRDLYRAEHHIGQDVSENIAEYKRRSPVWNVAKLKTPLLVFSNTNDEDVNVIEVEHLVQALKAEGKEFEYEIFEEMPGGHSFDRLDTRQAQEIRLRVYRFLARYLKPARPFGSVGELHAAGYR